VSRHEFSYRRWAHTCDFHGLLEILEFLGRSTSDIYYMAKASTLHQVVQKFMYLMLMDGISKILYEKALVHIVTSGRNCSLRSLSEPTGRVKLEIDNAIG
jgi:hypothetical protein